VAEIDFITALGRLLRDGNLRDAFTASPQTAAAQINLCRDDWPAFSRLAPEDLEFQARILLRKRLALVRQLLPETVRKLGEKFWPLFLEYSRVNWPMEQRTALHDAFGFCRRLKQQHSQLVSESEWNRLRFAISEKHLAIHWLLRETIHGRTRSMLQIFLRGRLVCWREMVFYFGL
jgi:hypothetical protein